MCSVQEQEIIRNNNVNQRERDRERERLFAVCLSLCLV